MSRYILIWKEETDGGGIEIFDSTFNTIQDMEKHIEYLEERSDRTGKSIRIVSVTDLSNKKINPNQAHLGRKKKGKGSGWHNESRKHSLARKGIIVKRK